MPSLPPDGPSGPSGAPSPGWGDAAPVPAGPAGGRTPAEPPTAPPAAAGPARPAQGRHRFGELLGLRNPRRHWRVIALRAAVLACVPLGGLAVLYVLIFLTGFGFGLFTASALIALLPVPFLVYWFVWLDRFDPARWEYLVLAFGWGACVATSLSLVVNTLGARAFRSFGIEEMWVAVWVAPVVEEVTKGLAPLLLFLLWRREVVSLADALMYAGLSATGFAMTENILYLGGVYISGHQLQGPLGAVVGVATLIVVRLGLTGFIHPLFTVMTGVGIGLAARSNRRWLRWLYPAVGLFLAMLLHGAWNFTALLAQQNRDVSFLGYLYFILTLPILFGVVALALWARTGPGRVVRSVLPEYVRAGWLSPPELGSLLTLRRRLWARRWARRIAGQDGVRAMRRYQIACTRLALWREAQMRGLRDWEPGDREPDLLARLSSDRHLFVGRDPFVPSAWWDGQRYTVTFPDGRRYPVQQHRPYLMPVPAIPRYPWETYGGGRWPAPVPGAFPGSGAAGHHGAPGGYPPAAGYGTPGGYPSAAGYGTPGGYPSAAGYGAPGGYPPAAGYGAPGGYPPPWGYGVPGGHVPPTHGAPGGHGVPAGWGAPANPPAGHVPGPSGQASGYPAVGYPRTGEHPQPSGYSQPETYGRPDPPQSPSGSDVPASPDATEGGHGSDESSWAFGSTAEPPPAPSGQEPPESPWSRPDEDDRPAPDR